MKKKGYEKISIKVRPKPLQMCLKFEYLFLKDDRIEVKRTY